MLILTQSVALFHDDDYEGKVKTNTSKAWVDEVAA